MYRLFHIISTMLLGSLCAAGMLPAADMGQAELILHSTIDSAPKAKPAFFPHAVHQNNFACAICHHSQGQNNQLMAYREGMQVYRCESCHNKGAEGIPQDHNTFKKVAHELCRGCHTERKKEGKTAGPTKCSGCHRKDLE